MTFSPLFMGLFWTAHITSVDSNVHSSRHNSLRKYSRQGTVNLCLKIAEWLGASDIAHSDDPIWDSLAAFGNYMLHQSSDGSSLGIWRLVSL
jgi:hypothetical protein